jgi:hypothetical protein
VLAAHMVDERAAAALALGRTTSTPWRVSRRIVAALMPGSSTGWAQPESIATRLRRSPCAEGSRPFHRWERSGRLQGASASIGSRAPTTGSAERSGKRFAEPRASMRHPETAGIGQDRGEDTPQRPVGPGARRSPRYGRGHGRPGACSRTPEGQVVMQDRQERQRSTCLTTSGRRRPVVLQHVLDEVDAPARAESSSSPSKR